MDLQVTDNFLSPVEYGNLYSEVMGCDFPWFFNDGILKTNEPKNYQYVHSFYLNQDYSEQFNLCVDLLDKIGVQKLDRFKANSNPRTIFHRSGGYHIDVNPPISSNQKTSIYYLNTNNGYTKFKKGGKIKCVANRLVTFHASLMHAGFSCTDQKRKVVFNINYE